jgi:DNA-binding beta-propeller fold protein YncE
MTITHFKNPRYLRSTVALFAVAGLFLLSACSSQKEVLKPVFFPPLPDEPHVQFLMSINDSSFMEDTSLFKGLVSGMERPDIKTRLLKPYGIALHKGVIYVCDTVPNTVFRIDLKAKTFESIKGNAGSGGLKKPVNLAIDEEGTLYVADSLRNEVMIYTGEGEFVQAFGRGILTKPVAVAVDKENIYVLDATDRVIKVLDRKTGTYIREFGKTAELGDNLVLPVGLARDDQGFLYVTNVATGKVIKLDADGHVILSFGKIGDFLGEFTRPKGIAVDKQGRIYVVDTGNQNVQIFSPERTLLLVFGSPGLIRGSLNLPAGIEVTTEFPDFFRKFVDPKFEPEELILVTSQGQSGSEMINVYAIGRYTGPFKKPSELQPPPAKAGAPSKPAAPVAPGVKSVPEAMDDGVDAPR